MERALSRTVRASIIRRQTNDISGQLSRRVVQSLHNVGCFVRPTPILRFRMPRALREVAEAAAALEGISTSDVARGGMNGDLRHQ